MTQSINDKPSRAVLPGETLPNALPLPLANLYYRRGYNPEKSASSFATISALIQAGASHSKYP